MGKLIEIQNLTISLNERCLYNDINLSINEEDRFIFLGPNGAGKSLLLELIALGYSEYLTKKYKGLSVSGRILNKNGEDLLEPSTERNTISFISQKDEFYNNSSILDEAETACHGIGLELDVEKLEILLNRFGINKNTKTKIKNGFSNGEEKLIHIITKLLLFPKADLFLMDEPLNHLSFQNSKVFNDILVEMINEKPNLSIIMVSHCRAVCFAQKAISFKADKTLKTTDFVPYDCFTHG